MNSFGLTALLLAGAAPVAEATVEFGRGSPCPVNAVVGLDLPDTCAQVSAVRQTLAERELQIMMEAATSPGETCRADSRPDKLSLPLNMAGLEHGAYTVVVNGIRADFNFPPPAAGQSPSGEG